MEGISATFQRRGLALAAFGTQIFCIGGMDSSNEPALTVDIYDTATGLWSKGPDLPDGKLKGFSCSAITQNGHVYVAALQGDLLRLSADERSWEVVGKLEHPRMAYRLVIAGRTQLIALGGEDGEEKQNARLGTAHALGQTAAHDPYYDHGTGDKHSQLI